MSMAPNLTTLLLVTSAFHVLALCAALYAGFPHPDTPFRVVGIVLFLYVLLTLVPLVFLPSPAWLAASSVSRVAGWQRCVDWIWMLLPFAVHS
jgi:hypothetical protein